MNLIVTQPVKEFPSFHGTGMFTTILASHWRTLILNHLNPVHTLILYLQSTFSSEILT
jgi:hypothetical protein